MSPRRLFGSGFALCTLVLACAPSRTNSARDPSIPIARKFVGAADVQVQSACVPSGPEKCFDAVDDNCNGVVDEGCGLPTGVLQFVVAWGDSPADVDLSLAIPGGTRIHEGMRAKNDFALDKDCPKDNCLDANVEVIVFQGPEPPRGDYTLEVKLSELRDARLPIPVSLAARVGKTVWNAHWTFDGKEDKKKFTFTL